MEAWFFWNGQGQTNSIIDYAGTEKLLVDANTSELRMRMNGLLNSDVLIGKPAVNAWHYVAAVFDTQGNELVNGEIAGVMRTYWDSLEGSQSDLRSISDTGDRFDLGIGIGKDPLNLESNRFHGFIFDPRVSLGALEPTELLFQVPEPDGRWCLGILLVLQLGRRR